MAKLIVKKGGSVFEQLELTEGREYTVGRDKSCDVVLENIKGISRKHLLIKFDGEWVVELLSRMNNLIMDGNTVKGSHISENKIFEVYPYYFSIQHEVENVAKATGKPNDKSREATQATVTNNLPAVREPANLTVSGSGQLGGHPSYPIIGGEDETLSEHNNQRVLILSVVGTDTGNDSIVQLDEDGPIWFSGRDPACAIFIDDSHASRNHFKVIRDMDQFFIEDLGSANGTELNGEHLKPEKRHKLVSGDEIKIMSVTINIEVRDPLFDHQVELAEKGLLAVNPYFQGFPQPPSFPQSPAKGAYSSTPFQPSSIIGHIKNLDWKKHKIRIAIGLGLFVMLIGLGFQEETKPRSKRPQKTESSSTSVTFDKLSPDQKAAVKDIINLARSNYTRMNYQLCISEINKLHKVIPVYEDSKALLTHCKNGQAILEQENVRQAKNRKQKEALERIGNIVVFCEENIDINTSIGELKTCLSDAIELDPANPQIIALIEKIEMRDAQREQARAKREQNAKLRTKGKRAYIKAVKLKQEDKLSQAAKQFKRFLAGRYPGLTKEKRDAKRELASVRAMLNKKVESLLNECEALKSNNQFKQAYKMCDLATKESPGSEKAKDLKAQTLSALRKEMASIYQDSVLEESLGNVDSAKEKWKLILKNNIETDEYYYKAKRKLKRYGDGI